MHELTKINQMAKPSLPGNGGGGFAGRKRLVFRASNDNRAPLDYLMRKYALYLAPFCVIVGAVVVWLLQT